MELLWSQSCHLNSIRSFTTIFQFCTFIDLSINVFQHRTFSVLKTIRCDNKTLSINFIRVSWSSYVATTFVFPVNDFMELFCSSSIPLTKKWMNFYKEISNSIWWKSGNLIQFICFSVWFNVECSLISCAL